MYEKGLVIDTLPDGSINVRIQRGKACAKCGACMSAGDHMIIKATNPDGAKAGDWVFLSIQTQGFFNAVLILYGLPLMALIVGSVAGYYLASRMGYKDISEPIGFAAGVISTVLTYLLIGGKEKRHPNSKYTPVARTAQK
ncbi:MAG: SoxR reducing system RseC family protein [Clostridiales bacterium]|jgi:sigma-E factor negative regulatory protein RseC|nr:SoxR reducing system RseC family protein [Clostridiales bacterium]